MKRVLVLLSAIALGLIAMPLGDSFGASPPVTVQPSLMNFGEVPVGGSRANEIYIANFGTFPLRVNINPNSPLLSVERTNFSLGPGNRTSVRVVFRATGVYPGERSGRIIVNTSAGTYYVPWRVRIVPPFGEKPPFPDYSKGVDETYIELSEIEPGEIRREIRLFNPFPYPIRVRVEARAPWIRPLHPYVVIPPFGYYMFPVLFYIEDFPMDILEGFLVFYFPWGAIDVRVVVKRPYGWYHPSRAVSVAPDRIDFGAVWYGEIKERSFMVKNNTPYPVWVRILDTAPWLMVYPYEANIAPYSSRAFRLRVNGSLLPHGVRYAYVWIDTPYGRLSVRVTARGGL